MHLRSLPLFSLPRLLLAAAAVLTAGCVSSPGDNLDPFGASVHQVMESQTWQAGDATPTLNGDRVSVAMERYRNRGATQSATNVTP